MRQIKSDYSKSKQAKAWENVIDSPRALGFQSLNARVKLSQVQQSNEFMNRGFKTNFSFNQNAPMKKRSGCTFGTAINGGRYLRGWKYDKRNGLRSFFAFPKNYDKSETRSSAKPIVKTWKNETTGKTFEVWQVKVQHEGGQVQIFPAIFNVGENKLVIERLGYVMNPKQFAHGQGYIGRYYRRKNM